MPVDNKAVILRWFKEVWNEGREETIDELLAPDAVVVGLGETEKEVHGPTEFKHFVGNMRAVLPDLKIQVEDAIAEGDKAVVRVVLEGLNNGVGLGSKATGRQVKVAGIVIVQLNAGRIVRGWNCWDQLGLLRQIGAAAVRPAPTTDRFLEPRRKTGS
jgi:steroid delta-isomerase-like uncharacterized protein